MQALTQIWARADPLDPHYLHQSSDSLAINDPALLVQLNGDPAIAEIGMGSIYFVNHPHVFKIALGPASGRRLPVQT